MIRELYRIFRSIFFFRMASTQSLNGMILPTSNGTNLPLVTSKGKKKRRRRKKRRAWEQRDSGIPKDGDAGRLGIQLITALRLSQDHMGV